MATACSNYSPALHEGRASCECRRGFFNVYVVETNDLCGLGVPNARRWISGRHARPRKPTAYAKMRARFYRNDFPPVTAMVAPDT